MKKKIEQLLNGKFKWERKPLFFSKEKITAVLKAGETVREELYFGTEENEKIRGYVTSSSRRLVPGISKFSGTTICLPYGIDAVGMQPGEICRGWLCFTTNVGEYKIAFEIEAEAQQIVSSAGEVKDLSMFVQTAQKNFREAHRLFTDENFSVVLKDRSVKEQALYEGLSVQPVTYQNLEEFLIEMGEKTPLLISLKNEEEEFYEITESVQESFEIYKNGWGHLRLEIQAVGDFIELEKKIVTDEDFIGSSFRVNYVIRAEKLGKGNRHGEIVVKSPYQELHYKILASKGTKIKINIRNNEKHLRMSLMRDYLDYRKNVLDFKTWISSSRYALNQLSESGYDYPEYKVYEAYLFHMEGMNEEAFEVLKAFRERVFTREDLEVAGAHLYVRMLTGFYKDEEYALRKISSFYAHKEDSFLLAWILYLMNSSRNERPSAAVYVLEKQFEKGSRNPLLYLEAWNCIKKDMSLLSRLNRFWIQVFLFAGKEEMLTEELVMRLAYLSGYEKNFNISLYRALVMGYEAFPSDDTLEAICKYIMKGDPGKKQYFHWFSLAVDHGLRITRLFEYYMETMDMSYQQELPKALLMYFTYNSDYLGDSQKAFLYANVIGYKEHQPEVYEEYCPHMKRFAEEKLAQDKMNENYAVLYQEFMTEPETPEGEVAIARKMFVHRLYCDEKNIHKVIVRHSQLKEEEIYPCVQSIAYPRIYTKDAVILFEDDQKRRYGSAIAYNLTPLMDDKKILPNVLKNGIREAGVLLNYCEYTSMNEENLEIFQELVNAEMFTERYKQIIRKKLLDYYASHVEGEKLDCYLENLDYRKYVQVDRKTLLEILIERSLFAQAINLIEEFGHEGVELSALLKVTSRMIVRCDFAQNEELLSLASMIYRAGKYDEIILQYLMEYRFGPIDELFAIWKSAKGFEMDTYALEEKLLKLLMFTEDERKEGEAVLSDYSRHRGKQKIIGAYLTQTAYGTLVRGYCMSKLVRRYLEHIYWNGWPVPFICRIALLKEAAKETAADEKQMELKKELFEECMKHNLLFSFFRKLPVKMLSPYQLDDKVYVECTAHPDAKVTLHYAIDSGLGLKPEYKSEPIRSQYEGIFTKTFTLFYGEVLQYYFSIEEDGSSRKTAERVMTMNQIEGNSISKYQMINQILSARKLGQEQETAEKMREFLRQEQYVKAMFVIERESE